MRHFSCALALGLLTSAAGAQVPSQPGGQAATAPPMLRVAPECVAATATRGDSLCVSRRDAIARALQANPQLKIASAQVSQARAQRVQGVAVPDPTFAAEWDGSKLPFGAGAGGGSSRVLGASLTIPFFDKFRQNGKIGTAGINASESDSLLVQQSIASQTSQTYDSLLAALRHRANLLEADSLARDFAKKTQARFDAGTVPRLDVVNAQVAVAQAGNVLIGNERDITNARSSLNRLLGRPLGAPLATSDSLDVPSALPSLPVLESAALLHRPDLLSLQHQQAGASATTALAKEFWYPDFTIGVSKDYLADPTPGLLMTGISLPIPLFYWNHAKGEIAQDKFREAELTATLRDGQAAVGQDVRAAWATADAALRQAVFLRDQLLPATREAYRIASASYALGGLSALEVNAARVALLTAESQYTDALAAANSARADLERAVATPLATLEPEHLNDQVQQIRHPCARRRGW